MPGSGFADATELFTAAEAFGRTVELDLACLTTSIASFARLGLPGSLTLNLSPALARVGPVQRPRRSSSCSTATASTPDGSSSS